VKTNRVNNLNKAKAAPAPDEISRMAECANENIIDIKKRLSYILFAGK
jgi:hypothetical protein